jgi:hypothetical protein
MHSQAWILRDMSEVRAQILFGALIFLIPAALAFFVWRDVISGWQEEKQQTTKPVAVLGRGALL